MEVYYILAIIIGALVLLLASGLPVALCFMVVNIFGATIYRGGSVGLQQLVISMWESISFAYLPVAMFILLGEILFRSGMAILAIGTVDKWMGRLPGRLGLLAIATATLFSTMSGSTVATTAMLGDVLVPEMKKRGYHTSISIGSVMGSGGLAMLIPPSGIAVLYAAIAQVSVAKLLIAGVIPGLLIALFYTTYVVGRCHLQPEVAPAYEVVYTPFSEKLKLAAKYVLPLFFVIFMVTGVMFVGIATPSEAASLGVLAAVILAVIYGRLSYAVVKKSIVSSTVVTSMILLILSSASAFGQLLAQSGAIRGLVSSIVDLPLDPMVMVVGMVFVLIIMGCFMSGAPMIMIAVPIFMPIIKALGFDPLWFGLIFLLCIEMGQTTPPFGVLLFTMQGVAPEGTKMADIVKAGIPFLICDALCMASVMVFPALATWLPYMMSG